MELKTAIELIGGGVVGNQKQVWADLGAGSGLFTKALSSLLAGGSTLYAVDNVLEKIELTDSEIELIQIENDFSDYLNEPHKHDGILMANALHFVSDKIPFLQKVKKSLKPNGLLIIVEYDLEHPNTWIPFPVSFERLKNMIADVPFSSIMKLSETPSMYENRVIYSAQIGI